MLKTKSSIDVNVNKWTRNLLRYKITRELIEEEKLKLSKKFGKEASYNDTIWEIFNKLVLQHINNFQALKGIYYEMAIFLNEEGKNPFQSLQNASKMELIHYKQSGLKRVEVIAAAKVSCSECSKLNGKTFNIDDAIKTLPLPNKKCKFHLHSGEFPFCRCTWAAAIDY